MKKPPPIITKFVLRTKDLEDPDEFPDGTYIVSWRHATFASCNVVKSENGWDTVDQWNTRNTFGGELPQEEQDLLEQAYQESMKLFDVVGTRDTVAAKDITSARFFYTEYQREHYGLDPNDPDADFELSLISNGDMNIRKVWDSEGTVHDEPSLVTFGELVAAEMVDWDSIPYLFCSEEY